MVYFISGHRDITIHEFQHNYAKVISDIITSDSKAEFVVGDYYGVDEMAQTFLHEMKQKYPNVKVTVYHMFDRPRNNIHQFPTAGGYRGDHHRDSAMTSASDKDIAWVRTGKENSGTAQNIVRRNVKNILHSLKFDDAVEFLQGMCNTIKDHPKDKDDLGVPVVYYP